MVSSGQTSAGGLQDPQERTGLAGGQDCYWTVRDHSEVSPLSKPSMKGSVAASLCKALFGNSFLPRSS